jgi:hypothetical protein
MIAVGTTKGKYLAVCWKLGEETHKFTPFVAGNNGVNEIISFHPQVYPGEKL